MAKELKKTLENVFVYTLEGFPNFTFYSLKSINAYIQVKRNWLLENMSLEEEYSPLVFKVDMSGCIVDVLHNIVLISDVTGKIKIPDDVSFSKHPVLFRKTCTESQFRLACDVMFVLPF